MPHIDQIPDGESVFVDTMIFYYHFTGRSQECTDFLTRIANDDIIAYVDTIVLTDLIHKLMLAEACHKGYISQPHAGKLKQKYQTNPNPLPLKDYKVQFNQTLSIGLRSLQISKTKLKKSYIHRQNYPLLTTDSIHLECLSRRGIKNIVTKDSDFKCLQNFIIWEPTDVI